jgi:hypothetical protein
MAATDDVRDELFTTLLRKIERDPYPSSTVMDLVEELADDEQRAAYGRVLMEKVQQDEYPSLDLIRRVKSLC